MPPAPATLLERIQRDVERNRVRARNGLKHLAGIGRPEVGCTPKETVWERGKVKLYRYHSDSRTIRPPLLLVMSLVTKPYVLDLRPGNSFVEKLVQRGFDVYMLDWGVPDAADANNTIETYTDELIPMACAVAMRTSGAREISVFGYCYGGVLSLVFAAANPQIPLRSLSLMATPIDFRSVQGPQAMVKAGVMSAEDAFDETGNVPADIVYRMIQMAKVSGDAASYASLIENLESSEYIAAHQALNGWATDHIPFPGAAAKQTAEWFIQDNRLAENRLVTSRGPVDLGAIRCPVMNVLGSIDHLIPMESNKPVEQHIAQIETIVLDAGHVGLIVGGKAQRAWIPTMVDWIARHSDDTNESGQSK